MIAVTEKKMVSALGRETLTIDRQQQALMDVATILTQIAGVLVTAGLGAGTAIKLWEMKQDRRDKQRAEAKQLNEAQLSANEQFTQDLLRETQDLRKLAQQVLTSQIAYERRIFELERDKTECAREKRDLQRLTEEQNEEVLLWKAKFEAEQRQSAHLQKRLIEVESENEQFKNRA